MCCAMMQNSQSAALKERQEAVIYYATGRKPIGRDPGMVYLMKEAIIVPIGTPRIVSQPKTNLLEIVQKPSQVRGAAFSGACTQDVNSKARTLVF